MQTIMILEHENVVHVYLYIVNIYQSKLGHKIGQVDVLYINASCELACHIQTFQLYYDVTILIKHMIISCNKRQTYKTNDVILYETIFHAY